MIRIDAERQTEKVDRQLKEQEVFLPEGREAHFEALESLKI